MHHHIQSTIYYDSYWWRVWFGQVNVYKDPITDSGKKSKKGQLTLEVKNGKFITTEEGQGDPKAVSS